MDNDVGSNWERGVPTPGVANSGLSFVDSDCNCKFLHDDIAVAFPAGTRPPRIDDAIHIVDYVNKKGFSIFLFDFSLSFSLLSRVYFNKSLGDFESRTHNACTIDCAVSSRFTWFIFRQFRCTISKVNKQKKTHCLKFSLLSFFKKSTNSANQWMSVIANDAGSDGDRLAGDTIFTAACPASMLVHRNLVRFIYFKK